jgi:hypothetical protein
MEKRDLATGLIPILSKETNHGSEEVCEARGS